MPPSLVANNKKTVHGLLLYVNTLMDDSNMYQMMEIQEPCKIYKMLKVLVFLMIFATFLLSFGAFLRDNLL